MFMNFIRSNKIVAGLLALLRIYIGYRWVTAGYAKIKSGGFDAGGFIQMASENSAVPGWWAAFLKAVALPNQELFSFMVMWGELLVGIALITGIFTNFAALMGVTMNLSFLFSGSGMLDAQMAVVTVFIVIAGRNAGRLGLDRWVLPMLSKKIKQTLHKKPKEKHVALA
ncbi:DoxX family protein [Ornithinibacillus halophilus]|uniref:Thiosulfate dehydrogenase [quinone] large subunit n=1 Tax=Ornithinibacillus halophilus TaxID=930117 RepID=A0A1M5FUS4_9BACI|nr:DoxX family protein [Ornithinibacillus halophilus]SHF95317.1 thiosulfate dehydrogenase [quinone] large subunit [Ornithinibacillus halophilus]